MTLFYVLCLNKQDEYPVLQYAFNNVFKRIEYLNIPTDFFSSSDYYNISL